jgi:hypothetical protein
MSSLFKPGCVRRALLAAIVASGLCLPTDVLAQMHGDHNPHHGGIVLMYGGDLHYEVVLSADGKVELYLSDSMRADLPAALVSDVVVEIERNGKREAVDMQIGDSGEFWQGKASAVKEEGSVLHLAFVFRGEAAVVEFPASALMGAGRQQLIKDSAHAK